MTSGYAERMLWILLVCGLMVVSCDGVTYELYIDPMQEVTADEPVTIAVKLFQTTHQYTDLFITFLPFTAPSDPKQNIFKYSLADGCEFLLEPFISTGIIEACDSNNQRYVISLAITPAHSGEYGLAAPYENPPAFQFTESVTYWTAPTLVAVKSSMGEVLEGETTDLVCTVDDKANLPLTLVWKIIASDGSRVNPTYDPPNFEEFLLPDGRGSALGWNSVSRQHAGQYECTASNEVGTLTSQPATLVVYYSATSVALTADSTKVPVGTTVTLTCTSDGGNPVPGLVIYEVDAGSTLKESAQSSSTTLASQQVMTESNDGMRYQCKTKAIISVGTIPVVESNILTIELLHPATSVTLTADSSTVSVGTTVTMTCTSVGGNPLPGLVIYDVTSGVTLIESAQSSSSSLTFQHLMEESDDGARYRCKTKVDVGALPVKESDILTFSVLFPATSVSLAADGTTVSVGTTVTMTCTSVGGNPTPGLVIYDVTSGATLKESTQPSSSKLTFPVVVQSSDNGAEYRCKTKVDVGGVAVTVKESNVLTLNVFYSVTSVTLTAASTTIVAGNTVTMTCTSVGGNPMPGLVIYDVTSGATLEESAQDSSTTLTFQRDVQSSDNGAEYQCKTKVDAGAAVPAKESNVLILSVLYSVTSVTLTADTTTIVAGNTVTMTCTSVGGNPMPGLVIYDVTSGASLKELAQSTSSSLTFQHLMEESDDGARYRCKTKVDVGALPVKESDILTFSVLFPATSVSLAADGTTVSVGTTVTMTCTSVGGNPTPGLVIYDVTSGATLKESTQSSSSTLTFSVVVQSSDNGAEYRCKTKVDVGGVAVPVKESNVLTLNVFYSVTSVTLTAASTTIVAGNTVTMTCTSVGGNPMPGLVIYDVTSGASLKESAQSSSSTLTFQHLMEEYDDGARYRCKTKVDVGALPVKESDILTFSVLFPATSMILNADSTTIVAGNTVTVTCTSVGGNPTPGLVIYDVTSGATLKESPQDSSTTLAFQREVQNSDNGAEYRCKTKVDVGGVAVPVKESNVLTLNVLYSVTFVTLTADSITIVAGTTVTMTCTSVGGNPMPGLVIYDITSGTTLKESAQSTTSTLTLQRLMEESDDGVRYRCKTKVDIGALPIKESDILTFTVLYPATSVTLIADSNPISVGATVTMTCKSVGGNPMPGLVIYDVASGATLKDSSQDSSTMLTFQRTVQSSDNGAEYRCKTKAIVGTTTIPVKESNILTLVVSNPVTSVILTADSTTVVAGNTVTVTCTSGGGDPTPGLIIYDVTSGATLKESAQSSSSSALTFERIMAESNNGAIYRCKTKVGAVPVGESNTITFDVQFSPNAIKAPDVLTIDEGQSATISCETTTSSNPKTELTWTGPAVGQSVEATSPGNHGGVTTAQVVTVTGNRTRNGAKYTCTAIHLGQNIHTDATNLVVNFSPRAIAFYNTFDTPILENEKRVLRCRAETSKPPGTITWRTLRGSSVSAIQTEPPTELTGDFGGTVLETEITIQPSREENGAKYWCEIDYTYSNGTKVTRRALPKQFDVQYGADVSIGISKDLDNIREGDFLTLTCETSGGNPPFIQRYAWTSDGKTIVGASGRSLNFNPIKYNHAGHYTCLAISRGGTTTASVVIDVKYEPKLDPLVKHEFEVESHLGGSVALTLTAIANPAVTSVEWTHEGGRAITSPRFAEGTEGNTFSLTIEDITEQDYAAYHCRVTNSVGAGDFQFKVLGVKNPETPTYFTVIEKSSSSLLLQWTPGNTLGQEYLLEVITGNNIVQKHVIDHELKPVVTYTVESLNPATEYRFKLRAKNDVNLTSGFVETSAVTKADMNALTITITRYDETTVIIDWSKIGHLFFDYPNARLLVELTPSHDKQSEAGNADLPQKVEAMFLDRKLSIHVLEAHVYTFNVIVYDGDGAVLERRNLKANRNPTLPIMTIIAIASGSACFLIVAAIVTTIICCKYKGSQQPDAKLPTVNELSRGSPNSADGFSNLFNNVTYSANGDDFNHDYEIVL